MAVAAVRKLPELDPAAYRAATESTPAQDGVRLFRIPVCAICRDPLQDFVWVSLVPIALVPTGFISGAQFVVEELLLFGVLVLVKHRLPRVFDRFTHQA